MVPGSQQGAVIGRSKQACICTIALVADMVLRELCWFSVGHEVPHLQRHWAYRSLQSHEIPRDHHAQARYS